MPCKLQIAIRSPLNRRLFVRSSSIDYCTSVIMEARLQRRRHVHAILHCRSLQLDCTVCARTRVHNLSYRDNRAYMCRTGV